MIRIENLEVRAGGRTLLALSGFSAGPGETALLIGPSGSGKTTLLNAIAGLIRPSAGLVEAAGQDLSKLSPAALDRFRGRTFGIVFQTLRLVRALSVRQNLALAQRLAGGKPDPARIEEALGRLGVAHLADARPQRLSLGEAQRAAIARAIVGRPKIILADEPTSALDDDNASAALSLLKSEAAALGATLVIATHDQRIKGAGDRVLDLGAAR